LPSLGSGPRMRLSLHTARRSRSSTMGGPAVLCSGGQRAQAQGRAGAARCESPEPCLSEDAAGGQQRFHTHTSGTSAGSGRGVALLPPAVSAACSPSRLGSAAETAPPAAPQSRTRASCRLRGRRSEATACRRRGRRWGEGLAGGTASAPQHLAVWDLCSPAQSFAFKWAISRLYCALQPTCSW
jgi:hypothetical protein